MDSDREIVRMVLEWVAWDSLQIFGVLECGTNTIVNQILIVTAVRVGYDKDLVKNEEWMIVVSSSIDTKSIPIIGELLSVVNE